MLEPSPFNTHIWKVQMRYTYLSMYISRTLRFCWISQDYLVSTDPLIILQKNLMTGIYIYTNQKSEQMGISLELTFNLHPDPSLKHSFLDILCCLCPRVLPSHSLFWHHPAVWLPRHVVSLTRARILPSPVASTSVAYLEFLQPSLSRNSWPCTTVLFWLLKAHTNLARFWLATQIFLTKSVFPWAHPCLPSLVVVEPVQ